MSKKEKQLNLTKSTTDFVTTGAKRSKVLKADFKIFLSENVKSSGIITKQCEKKILAALDGCGCDAQDGQNITRLFTRTFHATFEKRWLNLDRRLNVVESVLIGKDDKLNSHGVLITPKAPKGKGKKTTGKTPDKTASEFSELTKKAIKKEVDKEVKAVRKQAKTEKTALNKEVKAKAKELNKAQNGFDKLNVQLNKILAENSTLKQELDDIRFLSLHRSIDEVQAYFAVNQ